MWIIPFLTSFILTLLIGFYLLERKKQQKRLKRLIKELKKGNDKLRAEIKEKKAKDEYYKQETMNIYFQNLIDYEKDIKLTKQALEKWEKEIETERFNQMSLEYQKEVLENMLGLNNFIEKTNNKLEKTRKVLSIYCKNKGNISVEMVKEVMGYDELNIKENERK